MCNDVQIVIGSWGSYNECNERALGSSWIRLNNYESWDEITEELKKQGFELDGIDEELFIQDAEFPSDGSISWDYMHPEAFFEILKKSGVLDNEYKFKTMEAVIEVEGYREWERRVNTDENDWESNINIYSGYDWESLGRYFFYEVFGYKIPDELENYIDFQSYGESFRWDNFYEYSEGIIEFCR